MEKTKTAPNRRIKAAWLSKALELRNSGCELAEAEALLQEELKKEMSGSESLKKSTMYLRKIWLQPEPHIEKFTERVVQSYAEKPTPENANNLSFFLWLANYPFAREVTETVGKFLRLQGSVKSEQIRRRMCEARGERETVRRSTQYAVRLLLDFGYIVEQPQHGVYKACSPLISIDPHIAGVCLEAMFYSIPSIEYFRKRELETHAALFAFDAHGFIETAVSSSTFQNSRESYSEDVVSLKS